MIAPHWYALLLPFVLAVLELWLVYLLVLWRFAMTPKKTAFMGFVCVKLGLCKSDVRFLGFL